MDQNRTKFCVLYAKEYTVLKKSTPPPVVTVNMSYVCCVDLWPLKGLLLCLASSFDVSRIHMWSFLAQNHIIFSSSHHLFLLWWLPFLGISCWLCIVIGHLDFFCSFSRWFVFLCLLVFGSHVRPTDLPNQSPLRFDGSATGIIMYFHKIVIWLNSNQPWQFQIESLFWYSTLGCFYFSM